MKRTLLLTICLLTSIITSAQTQQGIVKTRGRMVKGVLQKGMPLEGATIQIKDRSAMVSGTDGKFSFPLQKNTYLLQSVKKNGYQLVDMEVCRNYQYSATPLYIVMETPDQQRSDQLAAEQKIRRNLQQQLQQKEDEIEALQTSQQEKDSLLQILYQQQTDNEKLIADMVKRYSTLDYDQLDEFYRQVSYFIENGELTRADSLLRTRGDINVQVQAIMQHGQAIQEQEKQLQQAKIVHQADIDEAAQRCYSYFETFFAQNQNDSAAHYIEMRATLDRTNMDWQDDAGLFFQIISNDQKTIDYYSNVLATMESLSEKDYRKIADYYNGIGGIYSKLGNYLKALEYCNKALTIIEEFLGSSHSDIAKCYTNIGNIYHKTGDCPKALEYHNKALIIYEKYYGPKDLDVAHTLYDIALVYDNQSDYSNALACLDKALAIFDKTFGTEHPYTMTVKEDIKKVKQKMAAQQ